jgi:hypothetical protein
MSEHGAGTALIFARTETSWFINSVWASPTASAALFLHGRVNFHRADGSRAEWNGGAPSVLIAYGNNDADKLRTSGLAGTYVTGWSAPAHTAPSAAA